MERKMGGKEEDEWKSGEVEGGIRRRRRSKS